jgi:multidrug resistance efflux pump
MKDSSHTFQITLPSLQWKMFWSWKALGFVALLLIVGMGVYWKKEIHPFVNIAGGTLQIAKREVFAEESGVLSELFGDDFFQKGQVLFSTKDPFLISKVQQALSKEEEQQKEIEALQGKLEQSMQQYVYVQNELPLQLSSTSVLDQMVGEIQKIQEQIRELEDGVTDLQITRSAMQHSMNASLAPFEGVVLQHFKQSGSRIEAGDLVFMIGEKERLWVEAEIEENMLAHVRAGLLAQIQFPSFPKKKWDGKVSWVSPVVERGTVKIRITADHLPLQPGLSANARIKIH